MPIASKAASVGGLFRFDIPKWKAHLDAVR
jgi:hypothetical protein